MVAVIGIWVGFAIGYIYSGTWLGAFEAAFLTFVLGILEVSLSFDNAVVNASVLRNMSAKWRHRFMTWGMLIAVFGMRIVFPLAVVSAVALISPWQALNLAAFRPDEYAKLMVMSHTTLCGFGSSFLLLVTLRYFLDQNKDVHWFELVEKPLSKIGKIVAADLVICAVIFYIISLFINDGRSSFLMAAGAGMGTFFFVHGLMHFLKVPKIHGHNIEKTSVTLFIYLEFLDASFSLDGVVGAFAITHNLFIIAAGLGIGAMFVRSLTLMLVEEKTLDEFLYLEHGAFYAIGALAGMMILDLFIHVPEVVTGLIGVAVIGLSLLSSLRHMKQGSL